ncbi:MAG: hypothetical protein JNK53_06410 [Phycisphaerae bacterium]|nr:hypothetical protein [Phycisphaerae bacterium]
MFDATSFTNNRARLDRIRPDPEARLYRKYYGHEERKAAVAMVEELHTSRSARLAARSRGCAFFTAREH